MKLANFIDGKWQEGTGAEYKAVINPANGDLQWFIDEAAAAKLEKK